MSKEGSNRPSSVWVTDFNTDSIKKFYEDFVEIEQNPMTDIVPIFINSYGGQVYSLIAKRDLIKSSNKPVATICLGKAMSCGASLLAAGTKGLRFASPDSRILIHQVSSMTLGKASDIKEDAAQVQALNEMMMKNLANDMGVSLNRLKNEIRKRDNADWTLTAEEAKKWGIIDHIGVPRHVYPSTSTILEVSMENLQKTKRK